MPACGGGPDPEPLPDGHPLWTAPRAMAISIDSQLTHEASPGDGVRAFVVSNRQGQLQAGSAHRKKIELSVARLQVEAGETIDFVVDIGDVLDSDQFLWTAAIREAGDPAAAANWNSQEDFPANRAAHLTAWEQLAQILLCSNEFVFID